MPHMLAQEHMSYVDALRYGTARNESTINAALAAIGSARATLVLTQTGDGIWVIGNNVTIPANVMLLMPAGVTVSISGGITLAVNGPIMAHNASWQTGAGVVTRNLGAFLELSNIQTGQIVCTHPTLATGVIVQDSVAAASRRIRLMTDQGGGVPGISIGLVDSDPQQTWQMITNSAGNWTLLRPGGASVMTITSYCVGIGPGFAGPSSTFYLQLSGDFAAKPGSGAWTIAASGRDYKIIKADFTDGLEALKRLNPMRYEYNGRGGMPTEQEFIGLIAEEVQEVAPYMVQAYTRDPQPGETGPQDALALNDAALTYLLRNAVVELDQRLMALEQAR